MLVCQSSPKNHCNGRDSLYIARKGHYVLGVDASQAGISQMLEEADKDNLNVNGVVADIVDYELTSDYNIILIEQSTPYVNKRQKTYCCS